MDLMWWAGMPFWRETPLALWLDCRLPGLGTWVLWLVLCTRGWLNSLLSFQLLSNLHSCSESGLLWPFLGHKCITYKGKLLFSLSLDNSVYRGTSAIIKINANYIVTHHYKEFIQNMFLFCLGYHFFFFFFLEKTQNLKNA